MRALPAVHRVLDEPAVAAFEATLGRETVKCAIERAFDRARVSKEERSYESLLRAVLAELEHRRLQTLVPVVNATGVIVHTNLGRAPLAAEALAEVVRVARGYSNLEYDLPTGGRNSRYARVADVVRDLTGAEDSLIVNNCAAAVLLVVDTFARGREVIVARNQLIEIGGGFRVPDVLDRGGATLVEVGTTNRVYIEDFERALSPRTALLLSMHPSNYRIEGFTHDPGAGALAALGRRAGVPFVEDLGSGAIADLSEYGLEHERTVAQALDDGAQLVTFSGDKLLGGPQAGVVVGVASLIARLRSNPLLRALRVDKLTLAALAATLQLYRDQGLRERIPIYRMLAATNADLRARAQPYLDAVSGAIAIESEAYVGGGALPQARIPSIAVAIATGAPDRLAAKLRQGSPAIVARIEEERVVLDLRTIAPEEDATVISALRRVIRAQS